MMLKDLAEIQQQLAGAEENMSNLTSASGDQTSVSSHPAPPPAKRKRSLPGNPDPEADVIALSPKSLMATNRYVCEICSKGFQRDQNLQLHRRGHNLPWKLKQRNPNEVVRKKVYVCPEATCVHHDPARALGDLTGIKKHFSRKHGEKKWKCDKCAKRYAVQSDWKAHSKVCGTREYRCDCGTLFSRRDSFITHRAFCDALAEESARAVTAAASQHPGLLFSQQMPAVVDPSQQLGMGGHGGMIQELCLKREQQQFAPSTWLTAQHQQQLEMAGVGSPGMFGSPRLGQEEFIGSSTPDSSAQPTGMTFGAFSSSATPAASSVHMSATALLQKAAQMGATLSRPSSQGQMASAHSSISATNAAAAASNVTTNYPGAGYGLAFEASPFRTNDDRATTDRDAGSDAVYGLAFEAPHFGTESRGRTDRDAGNGGAGARGGNDGMTRDFLGLRAFSHGDILSMAGFDPCMSTSASSASYEQGHSNKLPWHG